MDQPTPDRGREHEFGAVLRPVARDDGLRLIQRATGWLVAGAVVCAGAVSVAAANAFHGHTRSAGGRSSSTQVTSSSSVPLAPVQSAGLQAPAQAPSQALSQAPSQAPAPAQQAPSPVVSGGS